MKLRTLILPVMLLACIYACNAQSSHSVTLTWTQSTSPGVDGNKVYRGVTTGGPYVVVFTSPTAILTYTDFTVVASATYYYVVTATCSLCVPSESAFSNEAKAVIPANPQPVPPATLTITVK